MVLTQITKSLFDYCLFILPSTRRSPLWLVVVMVMKFNSRQPQPDVLEQDVNSTVLSGSTDMAFRYNSLMLIETIDQTSDASVYRILARFQKMPILVSQ